MKKIITIFTVFSILNTTAVFATLLQTYTDVKNGFSIKSPKDWGPVPLERNVNWHVARNNGTELPDCNIIVTKDWAFALVSAEKYANSQSQEKIKKMLSLSYGDVKIGNWEPNFHIGGEKALHYISSGTSDGFKLTSVTIQTIRNSRLYTLTCNAPSDDFPLMYVDLLHILDTFKFVKIPPN